MGKYPIVPCVICGVMFQSRPTHGGVTKCCSTGCAGQYRAKTYKHVGIPQTEEAKAKISAANKGHSHPAWNKGLHLSAEIKAKMSVARKGRRPSLETRARMSATNAWRGKHLPLETRLKLSEAHKKIVGWHHSEETKAKLKATMNSPEVREKIASKLRGRDNPFYGRHHTERTKMLLSESNRERMQDPEYRKKLLENGYKGWLVLTKQLQQYVKAGLPNPAERALGEVIELAVPGDYRYNDGWFVLGGKFPNFPNINGRKKLIELFGEGYHKQAEVETRTRYFADLGWDTLVIWAKELADRDAVINKVRQFTGGTRGM